MRISDMDSGFCCLARHANAIPPWTCDCPCHTKIERPTGITQEDIQTRAEELIAVCLDTVVSLELLNHIIELATAARDVRIAEIERYTRGF